MPADSLLPKQQHSLQSSNLIHLLLAHTQCRHLQNPLIYSDSMTVVKITIAFHSERNSNSTSVGGPSEMKCLNKTSVKMSKLLNANLQETSHTVWLDGMHLCSEHHSFANIMLELCQVLSQFSWISGKQRVTRRRPVSSEMQAGYFCWITMTYRYFWHASH